jgi:hypothetical protein
MSVDLTPLFLRAFELCAVREVAAAAENGLVKLVRNRHASAFLDEVTAFPHGRHDDCVDALAGAHSDVARYGGIATLSVPRGQIPHRSIARPRGPSSAIRAMSRANGWRCAWVFRFIPRRHAISGSGLRDGDSAHHEREADSLPAASDGTSPATLACALFVPALCQPK